MVIDGVPRSWRQGSPVVEGGRHCWFLQRSVAVCGDGMDLSTSAPKVSTYVRFGSVVMERALHENLLQES